MEKETVMQQRGWEGPVKWRHDIQGCKEGRRKEREKNNSSTTCCATILSVYQLYYLRLLVDICFSCNQSINHINMARF